MPLTARIFRLFVSSTFSDFVAEREALQKNVFPELEEYCARRGVRFQAVDLRWGITEEAQREHDTMRICLEEVRRCQQLSPRPNFAVLLGDRYGWEPPPARIPEAHWRRLLEAAAPADKLMILGGYHGPDLNAVPPQWHLNARTEDQRADEAAENRVLDALRRAAMAAGFDDDERLAYFASATHQEIKLGALHPEYSRDAQAHVHVFIRHLEGHIGSVTDPPQPVHAISTRLDALKEELRARLGSNVHDFIARRDGESGEALADHIAGFCAQFLEIHKRIIDEQLRTLPPEDDAQARHRLHLEFAQQRAEVFTGRRQMLEQIGAYLAAPGTAPPLILQGEGGLGKSSLLAKACLTPPSQWNTTGNRASPARVLARFIGAAPGTDSLIDLLSTLSTDIATMYGAAPPEPPQSLKAAARTLAGALDLPTSDQPLHVYIDALDQLDAIPSAFAIECLPRSLGEHVRMVITTRPDARLESAATLRFGRAPASLPGMTLQEGSDMLAAWLSDRREAHFNAGIAPSAGRTLTARQRELVLSVFRETGNPLWLKLASEEARGWASWHEPEPLPPTVGGLVREGILRRLRSGSEHPPVFAEHALACLTASRFGLAERELDRSLAMDTNVRAEFAEHARRTGQRWSDQTHLPPIMVSRLMFDLRPYLSLVQVDGSLLYRWFHKEFREAVEAQCLDKPQRRAQTHLHLAEVFRACAPELTVVTPPGGADAKPQPELLRRLMEQPWQLARAGNERRLRSLLDDFEFCLAKCAVGRAADLLQDANVVNVHLARFLRSNMRILQANPYSKRWASTQLFVQLSLEEPEDSHWCRKAEAWLSVNRLPWPLAYARRERSKPPSVQLFPPGQHGPTGLYARRDGQIVVQEADGNRSIFDPADGALMAELPGPGTAQDIAAGVIGERIDGELSADSSGPLGARRIALASGSTRSSARCEALWDVGAGRIFRWSPTPGDGVASLYDPVRDAWSKLPQMHHHQVWYAAGLQDGSVVSIGLSANAPAIVLWPFQLDLGLDRSSRTEASLEPTRLYAAGGPIQEGTFAGVAPLTEDGYFVAWPVTDDRCGALVRWRPRLRKGFGAVLSASAGLRGVLPLEDGRFVTWTTDGEVVLRSIDDVHLQPLKSGPSEGFRKVRDHASRAHHIEESFVPREDVRGSDLGAPDVHHGISQDMSWGQLLDAAVHEARRLLLPRRWLPATDTRIALPKAEERVPDVWRSWVYQYLLEDTQRSSPHYEDEQREQLLRAALDVLSKLAPNDRTVALLQTDALLRAGDISDWSEPPLPLRRLMAAAPGDAQLDLIWLMLCEVRGREVAAENCAALVSAKPDAWWLRLRLAHYLDEIDSVRARRLRLEASQLSGRPVEVRRAPQAGAFDLWEVILNGVATAWACERPGPSRFELDGERLVLFVEHGQEVRHLVERTA